MEEQGLRIESAENQQDALIKYKDYFNKYNFYVLKGEIEDNSKVAKLVYLKEEDVLIVFLKQEIKPYLTELVKEFVKENNKKLTKENFK